MKITQKIAEDIYLSSVKKNLCSDKKAVIFYSKDALIDKSNILKTNFPGNTLHAVAIKTCNNLDVLKCIVESGYGLEAASLEEVLLAKEAGAENKKIVFDSPVKTREEIAFCHRELPGIHANANSIEELDRYPSNFSGSIGLRINPLVNNTGGYFFNVSKPNSKFGVPIDKEGVIIESCLKHSTISCLHMHIGSGIKDFSSNIEAVRKIVALAHKINEARSNEGIKNKIDTIDIGGGIDFDTNEDGNDFTVEQFVKSLSGIPGFMDDFNLITEYGKFIHRSNSFVVSNIEYVTKNNEDMPALIYLHVGADLFVRKVYSDMKIDYPISVWRENEDEQDEQEEYDIVGPLCFAGDVLFKNVQLKKVKEGDKLFIYDIGANTLSMWSGHCHREQPEFLFV